MVVPEVVLGPCELECPEKPTKYQTGNNCDSSRTPSSEAPFTLASEAVPDTCSTAAAGAAAAFADVAGAGRAHLRAAGHAERAVDGASGDLLQELR